MVGGVVENLELGEYSEVRFPFPTLSFIPTSHQTHYSSYRGRERLIRLKGCVCVFVGTSVNLSQLRHNT